MWIRECLSWPKGMSVKYEKRKSNSRTKPNAHQKSPIHEIEDKRTTLFGLSQTRYGITPS